MIPPMELLGGRECRPAAHTFPQRLSADIQVRMKVFAGRAAQAQKCRLAGCRRKIKAQIYR